MMNRQPNVTYIDDLPELSDLAADDMMMLSPPPSSKSDNKGNMMMNKGPFPPDQDKYKKYIRNSNTPPKQFSESGMIPKSQLPPLPPQLQDDNDMMFYQPPQTLYGSPTCIDVANHINSCPICSKLYNNDKTMYVLCIIILAIICVILMKKCLGV